MKARMSPCVAMICCLVASQGSAQQTDEAYLLRSEIAPESTAKVSVRLEVGGDMLVRQEQEQKRLPLRVAGQLDFQEQIVTWSTEVDTLIRSVRKYANAKADIQVEDTGSQRTLPQEKQFLLAEVRAGQCRLAGATAPLSREELDLVDVVGDCLVLDRLLPNRELAEGESWDHGAEVIGALLGMDHVAVCEVASVVTGAAHHQVQIRLAGTVHGTIDGSASEIELRGGYLFHQTKKRITKFNLAVKEKRSAGEIVPGLDVVAKVYVTVKPQSGSLDLPAVVRSAAEETNKPLTPDLVYDARSRGFRFLYNASWYISAEDRNQVSFRLLHDGEFTAHCNLTTLPARSAGRHTTLEEFERDVRESLGEYLETVTMSRTWQTEQGYQCLGVIGRGKIKEVPVEWRYYLVATDGKPRVSLAVTLEQSQLSALADAESQIVDSLELFAVESQQERTARSKQQATRR